MRQAGEKGLTHGVPGLEIRGLDFILNERKVMEWLSIGSKWIRLTFKTALRLLYGSGLERARVGLGTLVRRP